MQENNASLFEPSTSRGAKTTGPNLFKNIKIFADDRFLARWIIYYAF